MSGEILATLLPFGVLFATGGYAYALSTSTAPDPKLTLLDSLLRLVDGEGTDSRRRRAA